MTDTITSTRVAVAQMRSGSDLATNLADIARLSARAAAGGAELVAFPEYATFLGDNSRFAEVAEPIETGQTVNAIRGMAREHGITISLGSTVEDGADGNVYNTSVLIGTAGEILATYRKIHLFTSSLPGAIGSESDYISEGSQLVVTPWQEWKLGLSICYDVRFPELYRELASLQADVLMVPSAFVTFTGPDHWEVLLRARAIENQAYVIAPAQIGPFEGGGASYGRSCIIDPWGTVLAVVGDDDGAGLAFAELKRSRVAQIRERLPVFASRRLGLAAAKI
jgi:deaminated glutathione amidase